MIFFAFLFYFPLETGILWEKRTFYVNARLLAFFATSAFVAPFVGWYTRITKDIKYPLIVGWSLCLVSMIIFACLGAGGSKASIGALFIAGAGFATPLALLFAAAQLATPPHLLGLATGQIIACRAVGQAFGASVLEDVFLSKVGTILPADVAAAAVKAGLPATSIVTFVTGIAAGNVTLIESAPGVTPQIIEAGSAAAIAAYVKSFHYGWYTAIAFVIIALLCVCTLDGPKMKKQMTWLVERPVAVIHHVHEHDEERRASRIGKA